MNRTTLQELLSRPIKCSDDYDQACLSLWNAGYYPHFYKITRFQVKKIETALGYSLDEKGIERADQLYRLGATTDEIIEAFTLL